MIDDILLFVELVNNHCQFNNTASKLGTSQATLSRKISLLEQNLGYQLFKRTANGIELTENGLTLYKNYLGIGNLIKERELTIQKKTDDYAIRIMSGHLTYQLILHLIDQELSKNPKLTFEINSYDKLSNINHYDISISLTPPSPIGAPMSHTEILMAMDVGLYCGKDYIKNYGNINNLYDLQQHRESLVLMAQIVENESLKVYNQWNNNNETLFIGPCRAIIRQLLLPPKQHLNNIILSATSLFMSEYYAADDYIRILPEYHFGKVKLFLTYNKLSTNPTINNIVKQVLEHYQKNYSLGFI